MKRVLRSLVITYLEFDVVTLTAFCLWLAILILAFVARAMFFLH